MPLTDDIQPFHVRVIPGQDTLTRDTLMEEKAALVVRNGRYDVQSGSLVKRPQMAYYNGTTLGANPVHSVFRYYTKTSKYLLAGYQGTIKVGTDATGAFTDILTGMTSDKKWTFAVYKDLCLMSNGYDNIQVTDGSVCWELGACKAVTIAGGSNLDESAAYYYAVTIDDDAYVCGAVSNTVTTGAAGGNRKVTLTNIPLGPLGTTNRKIYRTVGGGSALKLLATLADNTTTTYTDDIADGSLTDDYPAVTDDMPKGKFIKIVRERLLVANDPNSTPNRIYYSNPWLPHFIQGTSNEDFLDITPDDGDVITGIALFLGSLSVFKRNNIRKVNMDSADVETWLVEDPISFEGCPSPYSICQTPYGIVYQGWNHWYLFNGALSTPIIDQFNVRHDIRTAYLGSTVAFWHNESLYAAYVSEEGGSDYADRLMIYAWLRQAVNIDTVNVTSFTAYTGDAEAGELYYGDSKYGFVYLAENYERSISYKTKTQLNGNDSYPDTLFTGLDNIALKGTEEEPSMEIGWAVRIDDAVGTINAGYSGTAIIDRRGTEGTYTSEVFNISASAMGSIYWNEQLGTGGDVNVYTRTGATEAACLAASWSSALSSPNGSAIASTAAAFFQFKMVLSTTDITLTPKIVYQDGYVMKFTYTPGGKVVSTDIPFEIDLGDRNFGFPYIDKIYKKVVLVHEGTLGNVILYWETDEGYSGSFTISLSTYPNRWESFFPSTAYGRNIRFRVYKSDTNDYRVKEILGIWTPRPLI